jgi:hypothetical protein
MFSAQACRAECELKDDIACQARLKFQLISCTSYMSPPPAGGHARSLLLEPSVIYRFIDPKRCPGARNAPIQMEAMSSLG